MPGPPPSRPGRSRPTVRPLVATATLLLVMTALAWVGGGAGRSADESLRPGFVARIGTDRFRVGEPFPAALTPDGRHLLVGRRVIDPATGLAVGRVPDQLPDGVRVHRVVAATDGAVAALLVSRWDGKAHNRSVVLWDVATRASIRALPIDWQTLPGAFAAEHGLARNGHTLALGPGGRGMLFEDNRRQLVLWTGLDASPTPVVLGKTAAGGWYDGAGFAPDGRSVLEVGTTVRVWDAATGKLARTFPGPAGVTVRWAVSPSGRHLAVIAGTATPEEQAAHQTSYRVTLWDLTAGVEARELTSRLSSRTALSGDAFKLRFTPDGGTVVVADEDRAAGTWPVRRWRAVDGRALAGWTLPRPAGDSNTLLVPPGGRTLHLVTRLGVQTFDLETGAERSPADIRAGGDWPVGLTADDRQLVTRRGKDRVAVWDRETGRMLREELLPPAERVFDRHLAPDARLVAVDASVGPNNDRDTVVQDRATGRELYRLRGERCPAFGPDGKHLLTLSADYKTTNVRDPETGKLLRAVACDGDDGFFFSPDGTAFARPWRWNTGAFEMATGAAVFDGREFLPEHLKPTALRRVRGQQSEPSDTVLAYALGPGGRRLAVAATRKWDGDDRPPQDRVLVFDTAGKQRLWEANPESGRWFGYAGSTAAFSPDGATLAVGGERTLVLFDAETGKQLRALDGHLGAVRYLRFTRDGRRLIAADGDGTVWVWDAGRQ